MLNTARDREAGFSLIELLVVMAVGLVIMTAVVGTVLSLIRASQVSVEENFGQDLNRVGMERITRLLRQANYPEDGTPSNSNIFEKAESDELITFGDVDNDDDMERLRFRLVGDEIQQTTMETDDCSVSPCTYEALATSPTSMFIDSVRNEELDTGVCPDFPADEPVFTYFERASDGELSPMTSPVSPPLYGRIAAVEVSLVVDVTTEARAGCQRLSSLIHLRNWRG